MNTPQTHETIATPAGLVRLVTIDPESTFPPDIRARDRQAKIRAELSRGVKAPRPNHNARAARVSTYQDPGKLRTADQAVADLGKRADDDLTATERARARVLFTGWALESTDWHYAIFRPDAAAEGPARWAEPDWLGEIGSDAWRAYGMARALRARAGGLSYVTWAIDAAAGRVTFETTDDDGDTGRSWGYLSDAVNGPEAPPIMLADEYVWALRGVAWRVGRADLAAGTGRGDLVLQSRDNGIRVAIAARRP